MKRILILSVLFLFTISTQAAKGNKDLVTEAEDFGAYVAGKLTFGSNMRGSAEYRKQIAAVLVRRAMLAAGKDA